MSEHQPKLLDTKASHQSSNGPIFEFGPGWGAKTKKWLKKYILGGNCSLCRNTRYILLIGVIILIFGGPQLKNFVAKQPVNTLTGQIKITEIIQSGDSKIKITRKALSEYLIRFPNIKLTNGQKVFIETVLGQKIDDNSMRVGLSIDISFVDIESAIKASGSLTQSQLTRWEAAAKQVKF
ncbi:MAG: hypothetical protein AAB784_01640 [Patescibacteria group bacterium]